MYPSNTIVIGHIPIVVLYLKLRSDAILTVDSIFTILTVSTVFAISAIGPVNPVLTILTIFPVCTISPVNPILTILPIFAVGSILPIGTYRFDFVSIGIEQPLSVKRPVIDAIGILSHADYGCIAILAINTVFAINTILADDKDLVKLRLAKEKRMEGMNEAEIEAYKMTVLSEARAKSRAMEGYTYQDERRFDVLEGAAKNEGGAATFMNMGVGLGVGAGLGREIGRMTDATVQQPQQPQPQAGGRACSKCGNVMPTGARFCSGCGNALEPAPVFCPQCGNKCAEGALFCSSCGTRLQIPGKETLS